MNENNNSGSSGSKKKIAAAAAAVILAATLLIGGTISYLQSSTEEVVNKFSTNNVGVDIKETTEGYKIIPGTTQDKDPTVYVDTTLDSFVFLVVTDATDGLVEYEINTQYWTLLSSETDEDGVTTHVYYHYLDVSEETVDSESGSYKYGVLVDNQVSYSSSITNEDMYDSTTTTDEDGNETTTYTLKSGITLTFQAYAIQAEPFYSNTYDEESNTYDEATAATNAWYAVYYGITSSVSGDIETADDEEALKGALEDEETGYVILTSAIDLTNTLEIESEVTIDLAGYSITNSSGTAIEVTSDGALTITDSSSSDESGTISGTTSANTTGGAITVSGGTLTVESGTITGSVTGSNGRSAGAVHVDDGGTFYFEGGTISNVTVSSAESAAVRVSGGSTFVMSDGATITGCSSTSTSGYGIGAVYVTNNSTFTMEGGTISNCSVSGGTYSVGGVMVDNSTFTMSGGMISSCSGIRGGAVLVKGSSGIFTLSDGSITGNSASYSGGAIYIYDSGTMTMSGGSITNNTCSSGKGGGIRACSGTYVTITGGTISENTASSGNNAYIDSGCTLTDDSGILTDYYNGNE